MVDNMILGMSNKFKGEILYVRKVKITKNGIQGNSWHIRKLLQDPIDQTTFHFLKAEKTFEQVHC